MDIKCYNCFQEYDKRYEVCPHCGHIPNMIKREANHLAPGTILNNRYYVGEVCGFGGFGITYKAWDLKLEAVVAVKEYFPNGLVNRVPGTEKLIMFSGNKLKEFNYGLARFIEEARTMAKFGSHKNIVNVFEYFEANRTAYIVMEFLDGITLDKYLKQEGVEKLDCDTAIDITLNVCNALKTIHKAGIIHRDVSPDNIYLCVNGTIKLYDFGAARFSQDESKLLTIIVKPGYAPTEQYESSNPQGPWTDIYALGATLYHMITGNKPVESTNRKTNDELIEPVQLDGTIPEYLNNTIMKAMAIERHLRFQTIDELEEALKKERPVVPLAKERKRRKNKRNLGIAAAGIAVAAGCVVFGVNWWQQREDNTLPPADITIWYVADESGAESALTAIRDEFCENYDTVSITLTGIKRNEYQAKMDEAIANGAMPTLFQSDEVTVASNDVISLKPVFNELETENYWFLESYTANYPNYDKLPLGFHMPILYINTTKNTYSENSFSNVSEVVSSGGNFAVDNTNKDIYLQQFGSTAMQANVGAEQFYSGNAEAMFSDSSMYHTVRSALPARYRMLSIESESVQCVFINCWSMGKNSTAPEVKAAQRFLEFMLSDNSQDYYYIRNQYEALPLNKNALEVYADVYAEFEPLVENMDVYVIGDDPKNE